MAILAPLTGALHLFFSSITTTLLSTIVVIVVGEQKSKLNRILEKLNYLKPLEIIIVADNRMNTIQS
ncbi:hypothetical protein N3930_31385, partial [Bacillus thuringiensis]|nr:hypothetical protein [Bacillus thuringiensis]